MQCFLNNISDRKATPSAPTAGFWTFEFGDLRSAVGLEGVVNLVFESTTLLVDQEAVTLGE